jgi:hypothetical protein
MYFISFHCTKKSYEFAYQFSLFNFRYIWGFVVKAFKKTIPGFYSLEIHANKGITVNQSNHANHYLIGVNKEKKNLQKMSLSPLLGYATTIHSIRNDLVMNIRQCTQVLSQKSKY